MGWDRQATICFENLSSLPKTSHFGELTWIYGPFVLEIELNFKLLGFSYLEDHPSGCKWLTTMVIVP